MLDRFNDGLRRLEGCAEFLESKLSPVLARRDSASQGVPSSAVSTFEEMLENLESTIGRIQRLGDSIVL